MSNRKAIRCRHYNNDGQLVNVNEPCTHGNRCNFSHPGDSTWATATGNRGKKSRFGDFSSRPPDSGWAPRNRRESANEGNTPTWGNMSPPMSASRAQQPDSPWDQSAFSPQPPPLSSSSSSFRHPLPPSPNTTRNRRRSSGSFSKDSGSTSAHKPNDDNQAGGWGSNTGGGWGTGTGGGSGTDDGWGSGTGGGWGSGTGGGWGNSEGASGWGSYDPESAKSDDKMATSEVPNKGASNSIAAPDSWGGWGDSAPSTSNAQGNDIPVSNTWGSETKAKPSEAASSSKRVETSSPSRPNDMVPPSPSNPAPDRPRSNVDPFTSIVPEPTATSNVWHSVGVVPPVKSRVTKLREPSPSVSTAPSLSKDRPADYRTLIKLTISLVRRHAELQEAERTANKFKLIQNSKQLGRARKGGRDKMDQIRKDMKMNIGNIEMRIQKEKSDLLKVPEISNPTGPKIDLTVEGDKLRNYAAEIEAYLVDLKAFRESKLRAEKETKEAEKEKLASQPPPPVEPHIQAWETLKTRVIEITNSLHELSDACDEVWKFDTWQNLEEIEAEKRNEGDEEKRRANNPIFRMQGDIEDHHQDVEEVKDAMADLIRGVGEVRLAELDAKVKRNASVKAELEAKLAECEERRRQRRIEIDAISEKIRNLHNRKPPPIPYADILRPYLEKLVQHSMAELTPVLDALHNEHQIASLNIRRQSVDKINQKLVPILETSNAIRYHAEVVAEARKRS